MASSSQWVLLVSRGEEPLGEASELCLPPGFPVDLGVGEQSWGQSLPAS